MSFVNGSSMAGTASTRKNQSPSRESLTGIESVSVSHKSILKSVAAITRSKAKPSNKTDANQSSKHLSNVHSTETY